MLMNVANFSVIHSVGLIIELHIATKQFHFNSIKYYKCSYAMLMNVANFSVLIYSVGLIRSDIATRQLNFNSIKYYYTNGVKRPRPLFFAARQLIAT